MGNRIREWREKRNLTLEDLAHDADVSAGYLSRMETGNRNVSLKTLAKLSKALGVGARALISEGDEINGSKPPSPATTGSLSTDSLSTQERDEKSLLRLASIAARLALAAHNFDAEDNEIGALATVALRAFRGRQDLLDRLSQGEH